MLDVKVVIVSVRHGLDEVGVLAVLSGTVDLQLYAEEAVPIAIEDRLRFVVVGLDTAALGVPGVALRAVAVLVFVIVAVIIGIDQVEQVSTLDQPAAVGTAVVVLLLDRKSVV